MSDHPSEGETYPSAESLRSFPLLAAFACPYLLLASHVHMFDEKPLQQRSTGL